MNNKRYENMIYNRCGKSGVLLPAISLGLWHNFGDMTPYNTIKEMLTTAFDLGITHFDIANNYGPAPGAAEKNFGKALKNELKGHRDELIISTKAGYRMWPGPYGEWGSRKNLMASLDQSLKRIGIDYVDVFYSHRPDPDTPIEETMGALDSIVRQGKALYVGLSNYDADQTSIAIKTLNQLGTPCLIHQPRYSMFNRKIEEKLLDVVEQNGVGVMAFQCLAQGLLTDKYLDRIPEDSRVASESIFLQKKDITEEKLLKIKQLHSMAKDRGQTLAQMALAWSMRDARITSILIGASRKEQIIDNVNTLKNKELSNEELVKIEHILSR